ncbi:zinc-dependent peptidase [Xanthomonas massiliensis]|uniref:M90 family metallopeptidase n=1 Tax=Xanthomonas massiliensis TaxID=1720302 RepID=UPI000A711472|nr:M90 family metallopeptidase [Xanthomonas massiliensis]
MGLASLFGWLRPAPIDASLWQAQRDRCAWIAGLDEVRQARLHALAARFLHEKTISPVDGLQLTDGDRVLLAALCCLPLLEFGAGGLRGWSQLIVYPDAFRVHRSHMDAAGVLHEWDDELIGEAWDAGPLILSWADVEADLAEPDAGFCVAVHEMAHKLDALDGALDGTPPLPHAWQRQWAHDFQQAFDAMNQALDRHRYRGTMDTYAAESPEEFFAVASEYHFSAPHLLQAQMPDVAAHLQRFYGAAPQLR